MKEISFMVGEEIKRMMEENGKERETKGDRPGKGAMAKEQKEAGDSVRARLLLSSAIVSEGVTLVAVFLTSCPWPSPALFGSLYSASTLTVPIPSPSPFTGNWLAPGSSGHSSFWPLEV